ncbi:TonB family protein [Petrachloros mirabilis]
MTIAQETGCNHHNGARIIGWLLSIAFHGGLIICSLFFVKQVRLAPQPEPFKWNVALVSSEESVEAEKAVPVPHVQPSQPLAAKQPIAEAVPAPERPQPKRTEVPLPPPLSTAPTQAALPPSPPPAVPSPPPLKLPEPPPSPAPIREAAVPKPTPAPPPPEQAKLIEPTIANVPTPAPEAARPEPIPAPEPTPPVEQARIHEPEAIQPPPQAVKQIDPPQIQAKVAEAPPRPPAQEKVQESKPLQSPPPIQATRPTLSPTGQAPPEITHQSTARPAEEFQSTQEASSASAVPLTHTPKPEKPIASTGVESPPPAPPTQTTQPSPQQQVASLAPAQTPVRSKPDYRWLSELIVKRVEELKRYPAEARLEQAEGRVVVKIVIREDGSVSGAEVVKSSGFQSLDEAALDLMRQAGPFTFPHSLGKPSLTIKVPINYALDHP